MIVWILLAIIAVCAIWAVGIYNNLVTLKNKVKTAWGQIDVQLQRRYDLIPNLIETVKGYMGHEKGTLEAVVDARNQAKKAQETISKEGVPQEESIKELMKAETALRGSMGRIFALAESYPDLKANTTMQQLQNALSETEDKISFARETYNNSVRQYNTAQEIFPATLIAETFGHRPADLFEVEEQEAKKAVKVQF